MKKSTTAEKVVLIVLILGVIAYLVYHYFVEQRDFTFGMSPAITVEGTNIVVGNTHVKELVKEGASIGYTIEEMPGFYIVSKLDEEVEANTNITNILIESGDKSIANAYITNASNKTCNIQDATIPYVKVNLEGDYIKATYNGKVLNDMKYDASDDFFKGFEEYQDGSIMKKIKTLGKRYVVVMDYDKESKDLNSVTISLYEQFTQNI